MGSPERVKAWLFLIAIIVAIGMLPNLIDVSPPEGVLTITEAQFSLKEENAGAAVALPHNWKPEALYDLTIASPLRLSRPPTRHCSSSSPPPVTQ